jgi:hypothetical protein
LDVRQRRAGPRHVVLDAESLQSRRSIPFEASGDRRSVGVEGRQGRGVRSAAKGR